MSDTTSAEEFWETRYRSGDRIFSGNPNASLVHEVSDLAPGRALDLGCGEGADAIWLAERGWQVTATDVSTTALRRAAGHAADKGLGDRIDWQQHDLSRTFPQGSFDLVSAHFLHSPVVMPRDAILRSAAEAVTPGGVLLIVGHAGFPSWERDPDPSVDFPTPQGVLAALDLPSGQWEVQVSDVYEREATDPEGRTGTRADNTLKVRRRP